MTWKWAVHVPDAKLRRALEAAPELLEALREMVEEFEHMTGSRDVTGHVHRKARALLARIDKETT